MKAESGQALACQDLVRFTVAGAAQVRCLGACKLGLHGFEALLLPVELRRVNHAASTNIVDSKGRNFYKPYNSGVKADLSKTEQLAERVERLLLRYDEIMRTNELLRQHVELLTAERDSLKSRLSAARARVDALLDRLPSAEAEALGLTSSPTELKE